MKRYHEHPAEELYDVVADPCEMNNLAADPKPAATLRARSGEKGEVFGEPACWQTAA